MSGLTPDLVLWLMSNGERQSDIARAYGVSRQYVHMLAKQGGYQSPIATVRDNMPWEVEPAFGKNSALVGFRLVGHWRVSPDTVEKESINRARGFVRRLRTFNVVLDYDPAYPPIPGLTSTLGFAYVTRTECDEDFMMKIKPGVRVTPLGDKIWRIPPEWK